MLMGRLCSAIDTPTDELGERWTDQSADQSLLQPELDIKSLLDAVPLPKQQQQQQQQQQHQGPTTTTTTSSRRKLGRCDASEAQVS